MKLLALNNAIDCLILLTRSTRETIVVSVGPGGAYFLNSGTHSSLQNCLNSPTDLSSNWSSLNDKYISIIHMPSVEIVL